MAHLIYSAITSLDGYISDATREFDWAAPDEEVHDFVNALEGRVGTHLYGRRMYEVMLAWEDPQLSSDSSAAVREYAEIWRAAEKVVFSKTLATAPSARTRIERAFDPEVILRMKASSQRDISVGGPTLAACAFEAGLVDECHLLLSPILVGGGTRALPDGVRAKLALLDVRRFAGGVVHLHYRLGT